MSGEKSQFKLSRGRNCACLNNLRGPYTKIRFFPGACKCKCARVRARFDAIVVKTKCRPCCQVSKEPGNEIVEVLRTSYIQSGAWAGGENWGPSIFFHRIWGP